MKALGKLVTISILTAAMVGLLIGSCTSVKEPTPRVPEIPVVKLPEASPVVQLGPVQVGGLYCWEEVSDTGGLRGKFGGHNPTERPIRIRVSGESGLIKPGERFGSDSTYLGLEGRCVYPLSIVRSDSENAHLASEYNVELVGHMLTPPLAAALAIVTRFFYDVDRRDINSIKLYTKPSASASDLASYVGWRASNEPVTLETTGCDGPQFQNDTAYLLIPTAWRCNVNVTYAVLGRAESGTWVMGVVADLQSGHVSLVPGRP